MQDPGNNREAANKAAARWKKSQTDELKEQIIATFRLQKEYAFDSTDVGMGGMLRTQVKRLWADAFKDDPIRGFDFMTDDGQSY